MVLAFLGGHLHSSINTYGYEAVFALVALESVGVPIPGETALITAALYAATTHHLNISVIIPVAATAAIVGDNIGFALGRWGGYRILRRYGRYVRFDQRRLKIGLYVSANTAARSSSSDGASPSSAPTPPSSPAPTACAGPASSSSTQPEASPGP